LSNFDGSFFDKDYFENGRKSGKSWFENYQWMPKRSFREAFAFIDYLEIPNDAKILDVGCSKGFLVKAFRTLEYEADGCDISEYALSFAPSECWNCSTKESWISHSRNYTHVVCKDVLEHLNVVQLNEMMNNISLVASKMMVVVPMGDNGIYRIPQYHFDISHIIAQNEKWWYNQFNKCGWRIMKDCEYVPGLKDNWCYVRDGNHVFVLEKS
jgi:SAM-dependent methyltransferase